MHTPSAKAQGRNTPQTGTGVSKKNRNTQNVESGVVEINDQRRLLKMVENSNVIRQSVQRQAIIDGSSYSAQSTQSQETVQCKRLSLPNSESGTITNKVVQLARIQNRKLFDNKNKQEDLPDRAGIKSFDVFASDGTAKTIKVNVKGNGELRWFRYFIKGGQESQNQQGALPEFYFDVHDIPDYLPEWNYEEEAHESTGKIYGEVKIQSFKTPNGDQTVDVKKIDKNKIVVDRKFVIDALFDEGKMTEGYHVEYRQYVKGYFRFMDDPKPHKLYKSVNLDADSYNEDGNGPAAPYGRRNVGGQHDKYNIDNSGVVTYHAEDIPGVSLSKNERCEINLSFIGKLVVVSNDSEDPITDLMEHSWSFRGKVKNKGGGNFDIT